MRDTVLAVHVVAGTVALGLGPIWLLARLARNPGRAAAAGYHVAVGVASATGAVLAVTAPGLAWLLPLAVLTQALAVTGAVARRRDWRGWRSVQPHLLGGSYIALVTALLVAETGNAVFWVLPAVVGQVPIAVAKRRLHATGAAAVPA
jgi:hypothetical protein